VDLKNSDQRIQINPITPVPFERLKDIPEEQIPIESKPRNFIRDSLS